jgi:outer membrane protein assembly factor BamB
VAGVAGVAAVAADGPPALAAGAERVAGRGTGTGRAAGTGRGSGEGRAGRLLWEVRVSSGGGGIQTLLAGGGTVYAANGDAGTCAIDAASGKVSWRATGPVAYSAGPGAVFGFDVTRGITDVVALSAASGQALWRHDAGRLLDNATVGWLKYADGLVYVTPGTSEFTKAIQPAVRALNPQTGSRVWGVDITASSQEPAIAAGAVYACTDSRVVALNGSTGARLWQSASIGGEPGSLLSTGGVVSGSAITAGLGLETFALDATTGRLLWHSDLSGFAIAATNDLIYFMSSSITGDGGGQTTVWARHARSGKLTWTRTYPQGSAQAADGVLYISCGDGTLIAVAVTTGHTLWSYRLAAAVSDVAADGGAVYAADAKGTVYALQA